MVDIYRAASPLVTNTEVNSCLVGLVYSKTVEIIQHENDDF